MTPEQIKQLAKKKYPAKREWIDTLWIDYPNPGKGAFIKGYTTCQKTEVEPLQKEIERLKGLIEFSYRCDQRDMGIHEDEIDHNWEYYKQQNNL